MLCKFDWNGYTVTYRKGTMDEYIIYEVLNNKTYDMYMEAVKNPMVIIDLGAHIGSFSLMMLNAYPKAGVWSYEIAPENFNLLQLNIGNNKLHDRCKIYGFGVGRYSLMRVISSAGLNTGSHMVKEAIKDEGVPCLTVVATLDLETIFDITGGKEVDLVKCDIERSELEVFPYVSKETLRRSKCYVMEMHCDGSESDVLLYDALVKVFCGAGFEFKTINNVIYCFRRVD